MSQRGRIAAVDYGTVRIGLAISDIDQTIASPWDNYTRRGEQQDTLYFQRLAKEEKIVRFILGLPLHLDGRESKKSQEVRQFAVWLKRVTECEVVFFDERFTSYEAEQSLLAVDMSRRSRKKRLDKLAAQILLKNYLEATDRQMDERGIEDR